MIRAGDPHFLLIRFQLFLSVRIQIKLKNRYTKFLFEEHDVVEKEKKLLKSKNRGAGPNLVNFLK